jgi:hypothetical protein
MEKSELNGEKFARRAARTWRLRRQRHIGSSFKSLELLTLTLRAPAAFGRSITASACGAVHSARNVILMMLMRQQELAF